MNLFSSSEPLAQLTAAHKSGRAPGIYSVCSAHPHVIQACVRQAQEDGSALLVEATCNQVNQYGGYTGMTPADFSAYVAQIAAALNFPTGRIILGGDHLGINPWQDQPAVVAMEKARVMVHDFVAAGFSKIHLDASMHSASDDASKPLPPEVIARRAAELCLTAEAAHSQGLAASPPVYVIGTEVPPPGGAQAAHHGLQITQPADALQTLEVFHQAFKDLGLKAAWERVIALVVQPGVEFGDSEIHRYDPQRALALSRIAAESSQIIFEAHSTDYQTPQALRRLVQDHFAILKVGPELTFAFREAVFALAHIEQELLGQGPGSASSEIMAVVERVMVSHPQYWQKYYPGGPADQAYSRKYSLSDRIRYYWPYPEIQAALRQLFENLLRIPPTLALLSQYLPGALPAVVDGRLSNQPEALIQAHIRRVAQKYSAACQED